MGISNTPIESPKYSLNKEDVYKWSKNLLVFTAPALAVFFFQLSQGVDPKIALAVALLALYGMLADLFKKYSSGYQS